VFSQCSNQLDCLYTHYISLVRISRALFDFSVSHERLCSPEHGRKYVQSILYLILWPNSCFATAERGIAVGSRLSVRPLVDCDHVH